MDETLVTASNFEWRMSESYYMSIQLCLDGLSFCILDPVTNTYLLFGHVDLGSQDPNFAKHEEYLLKSKVFSARYRKVIVSIESPAFSMMPLSLYDENKAADVLALTGINIRHDDKVLRNDIELANATTIFSVPNFLYFFLRTQFANCEILHSSTPVISSMLLKSAGGKSGEDMHVSFAPGCMTIVATKQNKLQLCNRFYCRDTNDFVYVLLFAISQLEFDPQKTRIVVEGDIASNDSRINLLRRFIPHCYLAGRPSYFNYEFAPSTSEYKYHSLFLMPLCV